jgi:hypothetical protein
LSSLFALVCSEAYEYEICFEVFHSMHSYVSKQLVTVSTKCTRFIYKKILTIDYQVF